MASIRTPEIGQLVEVRGLPWLVLDVHPGARDGKEIRHHRVTLQPLDEGGEPRELTVIWEHEVLPRIDEVRGLPELRPDQWDRLEWFQALLLATKWSCASALDSLPVQSPFRGAIQLEEYQLEPVARALRMPRVKLLIADFVGAGKTIEAGLVVRELIARQRARRILIVCPASLQRQWAEEMREKFGLRFEIIDRERVLELQREYGIHVNPWSSYPRLITSMDYVKRSEPLRSFLADTSREGPIGRRRAWDLLIVDEVHNCVPQGKGAYVQDSDRTRMLRELLEHFEHRLFLTATPHNGYTESFTALLEMLDPLRFQRGPIVDRDSFQRNRDAVMVRRIKEEIVSDDGRKILPDRKVDAHEVHLDDEEQALHDALQAYIERRTRESGGDRTAVRFVLTLLKKRLLSSPRALALSLKVHMTHLVPDDEVDPEVFRRILRELRQDEEDDDERRDQREEEAVAEASGLFACGREVLGELAEMQDRADALSARPDSKARILLDWIEEHLRAGRQWRAGRLVVFTEYRATLEYLAECLEARGWGDAVVRIWGGMPLREREAAKEAFTAPPSRSAARILLATDAASEGLNLQAYCNELLHYEIPWNPNRMEQRNGRIDRKGQPADEVRCRHYVFAGREDQKYLDVVIDKVKNQRNDLGAVSEVIAARVERAMLGEADEVEDDAERIEIQRTDLGAQRLADEHELRRLWRRRASELHEELVRARTAWRLTPEAMRLVVDSAMRASRDGGLEEVSAGMLAGRAWKARDVPWPECTEALFDTKQGYSRALVFEPGHAWSDRGVPLEDVSLVHLDHPLMLRALAFFRRQLWASGFSGDADLCRASYKVLPRHQLTGIHAILIARLVALNGAGRKVAEELTWVGGRLRDDGIEWKAPAELEELVWTAGAWPRLESDLAVSLRKRYLEARRDLETKLDALRADQAKAMRTSLVERGKQDADEVRGLIRERIAEVERSLREAGKRVRQTEFEFQQEHDAEALQQWKEDEDWLRRRLEELREQERDEPARIREESDVRAKDVLAFPVGILFVLPDDTRGIAGKHDRPAGGVTSEQLYGLLRELELLLRAGIERIHPGDSWHGLLSSERLEKAESLQAQKRDAGGDPSLVECLYLDDLFTVLRKSKQLREALGLPELSGKGLKKSAQLLGRVRDAVMHHEDLAGPARDLARLPEIRDELIDLLDSMKQALSSGGPR